MQAEHFINSISLQRVNLLLCLKEAAQSYFLIFFFSNGDYDYDDDSDDDNDGEFDGITNVPHVLICQELQFGLLKLYLNTSVPNDWFHNDSTRSIYNFDIQRKKLNHF